MRPHLACRLSRTQRREGIRDDPYKAMHASLLRKSLSKMSVTQVICRVSITCPRSPLPAKRIMATQSVCVCVCLIGFLPDVYQSDMIIYVWGPTFNVTIRKTCLSFEPASSAESVCNATFTLCSRRPRQPRFPEM